MIDNDSLIAAVSRIVEMACKAKSNIFGYGIWTHHITDVARNGKRLAAKYDADTEIVELAALLHDYASVKDEALYENHHIHGPLEAEKILLELNFPLKKLRLLNTRLKRTEVALRLKDVALRHVVCVMPMQWRIFRIFRLYCNLLMHSTA